MNSIELMMTCSRGMDAWSSAGSPTTMNKRALSEMLGVSERSLTEWQQRGMPIAVNAGRGASNEYNPPAVFVWLINRAIAESAESPKDRLDRLRGDQIQREMAKEDGELGFLSDLGVHYERLIDATRAELLFNMPDALAAEQAIELGVEPDVSTIRRHVEDSLTKLSQYDPDDESDDSPGVDGQPDPDEAEAEREGVDS